MELDYFGALGVETPEESGAVADAATEDEGAAVEAEDPEISAAEGEEEGEKREEAAPEREREKEDGGEKSEDGEPRNEDKVQTKEERARNAAARRKAELEAAVQKAVQEAERERAEAKIQEELREIHALDPSVSTVEDLLKMESAKEFYAYVQKGNNFIDSFYLANRDKLSSRAQEAAKQQALTSALSKEHLAAHGRQRGQGSVPVPEEEMAYYRQFMPGATEADIRQHYNRYVQSRNR